MYDVLATSPHFEPFRLAIESSDWTPAETAFADMRSDQVSHMILELGSEHTMEPVLTAAAGSHPDSPYRRALVASVLIHRGWAVRTTAPANEVSAEQFRAFRTYIAQAEQVLIELCAAHPQFAPAWSLRILTARALELGTSEAYRRYQRLSRVVPNHLPGQCQMLQYLLPKWFGSAEEAQAFASRCVAEAPEGSASASVIALHQLERWSSAGNDAAVITSLWTADVIAELHTASEKMLAGPVPPLDQVRMQAHGFFGMVFWLAGERAAAARHLEQLDGRVTPFAWNYLNGGESTLAEVWRDVFAPEQDRVNR